jgi:hypothetical protein
VLDRPEGPAGFTGEWEFGRKTTGGVEVTSSIRGTVELQAAPMAMEGASVPCLCLWKGPGPETECGRDVLLAHSAGGAEWTVVSLSTTMIQ